MLVFASDLPPEISIVDLTTSRPPGPVQRLHISQSSSTREKIPCVQHKVLQTYLDYPDSIEHVEQKESLHPVQCGIPKLEVQLPVRRRISWNTSVLGFPVAGLWMCALCGRVWVWRFDALG